MKAIAAIDERRFEDEIVPVDVPQQKGKTLIFDTDEFPRRDTSLEALARLALVVGAFLAASTGIVGATVVTMGLLSLTTMRRRGYTPDTATGTLCGSGTLGQIIPPSIVLIILADQLASAADQAATMRKDLYKQATGQFSMPSEFNIISTSMSSTSLVE